MIVSGCCLLSGCAWLPGEITPKARLLEANAVDAGHAVRSAKTDGSQWPTLDWWKVYQDPQLNRLVAEATCGNPTLRVARARVNRTRAQALGAESTLLPQLDAAAVLMREHFSKNHFYPESYTDGMYWNNRASLDLSYDLDLWGRQQAAFAGALDALQVATAEKREVELDLQTAVVRAYVRLSLHHILGDIAQTTLQQRQEILAITEKRLAAGLATEIERSQAEAPVPSARAEVEKNQAALALLQSQLSLLTGHGPGKGERIHRPTLAPSFSAGIPSSLPADLVGRRPDVVARRWMVEAEAEGIKEAKAAFYPNINLTAFIGLQSIGFGQFFSGDAQMYGLAPAFHLPLFDGGRLRSGLLAAASSYDMAVESYNATLLQALEEISSQLVLLQSLEKQRTEAQRAKSLADKAYGIALRAYRAGLTDYLSVLNAQQQTLVEATRTARIEAEYLDAHVVLMQALGGGAQESGPLLTRTTPRKSQP